MIEPLFVWRSPCLGWTVTGVFLFVITHTQNTIIHQTAVISYLRIHPAVSSQYHFYIYLNPSKLQAWTFLYNLLFIGKENIFFFLFCGCCWWPTGDKPDNTMTTKSNNYYWSVADQSGWFVDVYLPKNALLGHGTCQYLLNNFDFFFLHCHSIENNYGNKTTKEKILPSVHFYCHSLELSLLVFTNHWKTKGKIYFVQFERKKIMGWRGEIFFLFRRGEI